jgi:hypothetical protein
MKDQSQEILVRIEKFESIIDSFSIPSLKDNLKNLFNTVGVRFCSAPGSNRTEYHDCYPGGLFDHSIKVWSTLIGLHNKLCPETYSSDTLKLVAMFHDLGKIGSKEDDYYLPQDSDWHRDKLGELYVVNKELTYLHHSERSLWWLSEFGIKLNEEETQAISYHDHLYIEKGELVKHKETKLLMMLHWADYWNSHFSNIGEKK